MTGEEKFDKLIEKIGYTRNELRGKNVACWEITEPIRLSHLIERLREFETVDSGTDPFITFAFRNDAGEVYSETVSITAWPTRTKIVQ